jgi:hypothetical protein
LTFIASLIYVLTDENPEMRLYATTQGLKNTLLSKNGKQFLLETEGGLNGYNIEDVNDRITLHAIFDLVTEQILQFS